MRNSAWTEICSSILSSIVSPHLVKLFYIFPGTQILLRIPTDFKILLYWNQSTDWKGSEWNVQINYCHTEHVITDLLLTAIHSLRSSPSGSATASRRFPLPSVTAAWRIKSYWCVPSGMFFFGLKVLLLRLPLKVNIKV